MESITGIDDADAFQAIWERFIAFVKKPIPQPIAPSAIPIINVNPETVTLTPTYKIVQSSDNDLTQVDQTHAVVSINAFLIHTVIDSMTDTMDTVQGLSTLIPSLICTTLFLQKRKTQQGPFIIKGLRTIHNHICNSPDSLLNNC